MQKLTIENSSITITTNIEEIREQLTEELKPFDLIIQDEDIAVAKKMATQINKLKGEIKSTRKNKVALLSAPISKLSDDLTSLVDICDTARNKLLVQIKVFDDKKIEICKERLENELTVTYKKFEIKSEYQTVNVNDLAIISNMTKHDLSKKTIDTIDGRVMLVKQFQDKVDTRLLTLEGDCLREGLQTPLTIENIRHFLKAEDDSVYQEKLNVLIDNEIFRIAEMQKRIDIKAKKAASLKPVDTIVAPAIVEPTRINTLPQQNIQQVKPQQKPQHANLRNNIFATPKKKRYVVTAVFEVEVDESVALKLEAMMLKRFQDAKFKTVPQIYVQEAQDVYSA